MDKRAIKKQEALSSLMKSCDVQSVAEQFGLSVSTVKRWQREINKTETKKKISNSDSLKDGFVASAKEIVDNSLLLIKKRIDTALKFEDELVRLLNIIAMDDDLPQKEKTAFITKLRNLEIQKIGEVISAVNSFCAHNENEREEHNFKLEIKVDE